MVGGRRRRRTPDGPDGGPERAKQGRGCQEDGFFGARDPEPERAAESEGARAGSFEWMCVTPRVRREQLGGPSGPPLSWSELGPERAPLGWARRCRGYGKRRWGPERASPWERWGGARAGPPSDGAAKTPCTPLGSRRVAGVYGSGLAKPCLFLLLYTSGASSQVSPPKRLVLGGSSPV